MGLSVSAPNCIHTVVLTVTENIFGRFCLKAAITVSISEKAHTEHSGDRIFDEDETKFRRTVGVIGRNNSLVHRMHYHVEVDGRRKFGQEFSIKHLNQMFGFRPASIWYSLQ